MKEIMHQKKKKTSTWGIVDKPRDKKVVGCRWIFTVKYKVDESVDKYKVRLVGNGYNQTYGIDYEETFSPIAKMNIVQVVLVI